MYDRILVASDGSDTADRAVNQAIELARQSAAELHAVYVIETRTGYDNAIVDPDIVRKNLREEGEVALNTIESKSGSKISAVTSILEGIPPEKLLEYVDAHGIDLVVMGAKGRSAFKTVLLGSTTEAILRADTVPVLVVNSSAERSEHQS